MLTRTVSIRRVQPTAKMSALLASKAVSLYPKPPVTGSTKKQLNLKALPLQSLNEECFNLAADPVSLNPKL